MQIVIDIPDRIYKIIQNKKLNIIDDEILEQAVKNGTPLPKGHGDLVDKNDLKYEKYNSYAYAIANAPTIIGADKEDKT